MLLAIADCNNFYASCERVFQPQYINRPVVVLSNNDGCVVARSNEAKALGIAMGVPYWQVSQLIEKNKVAVFSSNYQLYGDMSARVMQMLAQNAYEIEIYSIDEAFLKFEIQHDNVSSIIAKADMIRKNIEQGTGIPISIGIAPSKTLAKLSNHIAKKISKTGSFAIIHPLEEKELLSKLSVEELWGIGPAYYRKLKSYGIDTVWQLMQKPEGWMRKQFTVQGLRLLKELRGEPCIGFEEDPTERQNMVVSRAFRRDVYKIEELKEAISHFAERMAEKLRKYNQIATHISIFLLVNPYKNIPDYKGPRYFSQSGQLAISSSNATEIIQLSKQLLQLCFREGLNYKKAGIMAWGLQKKEGLQMSIFENEAKHLRMAKIMTCFDQMNQKFGKGTLSTAAATVTSHNRWQRKEEHRSNRYTTSWAELLEVNANHPLQIKMNRGQK